MLNEAFLVLQKQIEKAQQESEIALEDFILKQTESCPFKDRLRAEHLGLGPLTPLVLDEAVTEILINGEDQIWFEKEGRWNCSEQSFLSLQTFSNFFHRVCAESKIVTNINAPRGDGRFRNFRLCVVQRPIVQSLFQMSFRRQRQSAIDFATLEKQGWASAEAIEQLRGLLKSHASIIVVGSTGTGKTTILNSCLNEISNTERAVIIEDTDELLTPNPLSTKLLSRKDSQGHLDEVSLADLVKLSLRLRPDRIVMGEVRGEEAKDLLMAFATGHKGGLGTLHADNAQQALLRLEMLVQLGAPQWNVLAVRQLIHLSVDAILVLKMVDGQRRFASLSKIASLESFGFCLEQIA